MAATGDKDPSLSAEHVCVPWIELEAMATANLAAKGEDASSWPEATWQVALSHLLERGTLLRCPRHPGKFMWGVPA